MDTSFISKMVEEIDPSSPRQHLVSEPANFMSSSPSFAEFMGSLLSTNHHVYKKSRKHRVGESFLRCACTGTVGLVFLMSLVIAVVGVAKVITAGYFWSQCPLSPKLPVFLLMSGLLPATFYCTCRTRRMVRGHVPQEQRIVGRWQYSLFSRTFDTQTDWQTGLAALVAVFLLVWLTYGSVVTGLTLHEVEAAPNGCLPPCPRAGHRVTAANTTATGAAPLLSLSHLANQTAPNRTGTPGEHSPSLSSSELSASSSPSSASSSSSSSSSSPSTKSSLSSTSSESAPSSSSSKSSSSSSKSSSTSVSAPSPSLSSSSSSSSSSSLQSSNSRTDKNHTLTESESRRRCLFCDKTFLTMCVSFVLFDWALTAALIINLCVVCCVPFCCFPNTNDMIRDYATIEIDV